MGSSAAAAASEEMGAPRPQHEKPTRKVDGYDVDAPSGVMEGSIGRSKRGEMPPSARDGEAATMAFLDEMSSLRGAASRALHSPGDTNPFESSDNSTTIHPVDAPPPAAAVKSEDGAHAMLMTILCFLILAPCLVAAVAQTVYCWKKRQRERVERELVAVSTNPISRMLVLSEIFKNDSKPVTEEDASPRKKRVLVKKHRKKTASERRGADPEDGGGGEVSSDEDDVELGGWRGRDDETPMIVYVSSFEHLESTHVMADVEQLSHESTTGDETEDIEEEVSGEHPIREGQPTGGGVEQEKNSGEESSDKDAANEMEGGAKNGVSDDEKKARSEDFELGRDDEQVLVAREQHERDSTAGDGPQKVMLAPKIPSMPSLHEDDVELEDRAPRKSPKGLAMPTDEAPDIPDLSIAEASSPKSYLSSRALSPNPSLMGLNESAPSTPLPLNLPDLSSDDDTDDGAGIGPAGRGSIFRANSEEDTDGDAQSIPAIQGCGSSVTEVTSNIDMLKDAMSTGSFEDMKLEPIHTRPSKEESAAAMYLPYRTQTMSEDASKRSGLDASVPIAKVDSYVSGTSSNVSYFSYEDVSIASDESEMCAICICPYEEGDIRIFSKNCPHAFHKECILEWLVKSHNECPCCRKEMVTKSEIEQVSASLIGTERLAQAMAVVDGSEMREAPPFHGIRRSQLARQIAVARARTRALRQRPGATREPEAPPVLSPQSPNAHWMWASRFDDGPSDSPSAPAQSPGRTTVGLSSSTTTSPRRATRFNRSSSNSSQPTTINPTRSSDAIMNPHESNQSNGAAPRTPDRDASMHDSTAGSLFSSTMYHDHWHRRSMNQTQRRTSNQAVTLSPRRVHSHWRSQSSTSSNDAEAPLPVTVLPAM